MSRMIVHPCQSLDNNRYARECPQICAKTVGLCSLSQCDLDTSQLFLFQLRFAARSSRAPQCPAAATLPLHVPAAYTLAAYLQFSGNPCQDHLANREQSSRSLPSLPHGLEIPSLSNVSFHALHHTIKQKILSLYYARFSKSRTLEKDAYSLDVEHDFWQWEEFETLKKHYEELRKE